MGVEKFPCTFKRGGGGGHEIVYPVLGGGARQVSDPQFSHFVAPHTVINDQSHRGKGEEFKGLWIQNMYM